MVRGLVAEYEVEPARLREDLLALTERLVENGLVELQASQVPAKD
jgi:hypothetical protein